MKRAPTLLLFAFAFTLPTSAQAPRDSVQVNTSLPANSGQIAVAAHGNLSAIVWNDATSEEVSVVTSDGRGLTWGPQIRVDNDSFGKKTELDAVWCSETNVYVVYESNSGLFFVRSTDSGASYSTPSALDVGPGPITDWAVTMSPDPAGDHVYVLCSTDVAGDDDLFLTSSHDDGATFSAAVAVRAGSSADVDELDVTAVGNVVHVAWDDNRSLRDTVYYQRSIDGGATFLPADVELGDAVGVEDSQAPLRMASRGNTVAVMWNEEETGSGDEVLQVNVSTNAGVTFSGPKTLGTADVDEGEVAIDNNTGNVVVAWEDNRTGADEVYATASADGGLTYLPDDQLSTTGAEKPRVVSGDRSTVVAWEETLFPRSLEASVSYDGGSTWDPKITVSDNDPDSVDFVTLAHDDVYGNFIFGWKSINGSDGNVYAGGFRPQTLTPNGWVAGPTSASFTLEHFDPSLVFGAVLISGSPGSLPLPFGDGRDVGLTLDALFLTSINLAVSTLGTPIAIDGSGSTAPVPLNLPPGFSFFAVGYQFGTPSGVVTFGELTDVTPLP